jgi:CHAD domain-containing protein
VEADHAELIETLQAQMQPVAARDTMAEAGRKVLLDQFVKLLQYEAGSRSGEDIEDLHDMRVATRRIRSALRLLGDYYEPKPVRTYRRQLQKVARALGVVRNFDVLIADLRQFQVTMDERHQADLQAVIDRLDAEREQARAELNRALDKGSYRQFLRDFSEFVTTPGLGAKHVDGSSSPSQVRHLLPVLIYSHLGAVRAYDDVIKEADGAALHALRIELKRLRYTVSLFSNVLGRTVKSFIQEIKTMQDHLGRMQDIVTAQTMLNPMVCELSDGQGETLQLYLDRIEAECQQLRRQFPELWAHFNTRTVQKQLATAIVAL